MPTWEYSFCFCNFTAKENKYGDRNNTEKKGVGEDRFNHFAELQGFGRRGTFPPYPSTP